MNKYLVHRNGLLKVLWDVQRKKRFIGHNDITKIAEAFNISRMELEGVITFYHFFHRQDAGKYTIYLNDCIVSQFSGREAIKEAFEKEIGVSTGEVSKDKKFGLFTTPCIGLSDQEPACLINFKPFTNLTPQKVKDIISHINNGGKLKDICDTPESTLQYLPSPEKTVFFKPYQLYSSLIHLEQKTPDEILETVKEARVSGYGGAFFPCGIKWQICKENASDIKYILCNADEGEPGTFKDRVLLERQPEIVIEGMIYAAYVVGAQQGAIYLRAEYMYLKDKLESLLEKYRKNGFLGEHIPAKIPFEFDIYIELGAGSYVCGEETAMIHSMEGKRGEPGTKEYFPVEKGFNGKPSVVNNVETFAAIPRIFEMGLEKWLSLGTEKSPGTKILSVSGDCKNPGIYEIEWGMKMAEFIKLTGAENPKMIQFSGPSGVTLSKEDFKRTISREDLSCGGSVLIFDNTRDLLFILKTFSDFFVAESCGICVPCRTGNFLLNQKFQKLINGHAEEKDLNDMQSWSKIIKTTSRCGLGQMAPNSLVDSIQKFPEVFEKLITENSDFNKSFDLESAVFEYDNIINEITSDYE